MKKAIKQSMALVLCLLMVLSCFNALAFTGIGAVAAQAAENVPMAGDINGDGTVNNKDLTRLMKYISGEEVEVVAVTVDPNGDGTENNKDLTRLMKFLAGEAVEIYLMGCAHEMTAIAAKAAACEEDGNIAYWYCEKCGTYFADKDAGKEIKWEDTIIPAGHTEVLDEAVSPTYYETGLTEGSHCSVCGKVLKEQEIVPVLEPTYHSITYKNLKTATVPVEYTRYAEHEGFDLPEDITAANYKFEGWYTQPEGGEKVIYIEAGSTKNYVLYAHWSLVNYTITYKDAPVNSNPTSYTVEDEIFLAAPEWSGLRFVGWSVGASGEMIDKIELGTTGHLQLTATWKQDKNIAVPQTNSRPLLTDIDTVNGKYLFIYELGTIQNVVLDEIKTGGNNTSYDLYNKTTVADRTLTISQSVSVTENRATDIAKTVSNSVTQTADWSEAEEKAKSYSETESREVNSEIGVNVQKIISAKIAATIGNSWTNTTSINTVTAHGGSISESGEESATIASAVEYGTTLGKEQSVTVNVPGSMPNGFYAYVHAGNVKVYAAVMYDIVTGDYTLTTYNILDNTYELLLYARDANELNSQEGEALPYDIPLDEIASIAESAHYIEYNLMTQDTTKAVPADIVNPNSNIFYYTGTEQLSFAEPIRSEYDEFLGWYADPEFITPVDEAWIANWLAKCDENLQKTPVEKEQLNITLYAKWDLAVYYNTLASVPQIGAGYGTRIVVDWSAYPAGTHDYVAAIDPDGNGKREDNVRNTNIDVYADVTDVYFIGNPDATYTGLHIIPCCYLANQKLTLHFENFNFTGSIWPNADEGVHLIIDCMGTNSLDGLISDGTIHGFTDITFVGSGTMDIYGKDGANATSAGGKGGDGTVALDVDNLVVNMTGTLNVYGGDGGNGANGTNGSDGQTTDEYTFVKKVSNGLWYIKTINRYNTASSGEDGGKGGNGGTGSKPIAVTTIDAVSGQINLIYGDGGNGGNGGKGGNGGNGHSFYGYKYSADYLICYEPGKGGNGGNGGDGGDAGHSESQQYSFESDLIKIVRGYNGVPGVGGIAGSAGIGGLGGSIDTGTNAYSCDNASNGSSGKSGNNGAA